jgi:hypothetical protein
VFLWQGGEGKCDVYNEKPHSSSLIDCKLVKERDDVKLECGHAQGDASSHI